jgi:hypothetical protein
MKRLTVFALGALLIVGALAACGGGNDSTSKPRTTSLGTTPASPGATPTTVPTNRVSEGAVGQSLTSGPSKVTVYT